MTILILPDIFGHTPALDHLADHLKGHPLNQPGQTAAKGGNTCSPPAVEILDPYNGKLSFRREDKAYRYFTRHMDIPAYSHLALGRLAVMDGPVFILGFSVGAAALWHLSGQTGLPPVAGAMGFYGSRIRDHADIRPQFDIHLVFPETEPHFDVDLLMSELKKMPQVSCEKTPGGHGFMNAYSNNYSPDLYHRFTAVDIPERYARSRAE